MQLINHFVNFIDQENVSPTQTTPHAKAEPIGFLNQFVNFIDQHIVSPIQDGCAAPGNETSSTLKPTGEEMSFPKAFGNAVGTVKTYFHKPQASEVNVTTKKLGDTNFVNQKKLNSPSGAKLEIKPSSTLMPIGEEMSIPQAFGNAVGTVANYFHKPEVSEINVTTKKLGDTNIHGKDSETITQRVLLISNALHPQNDTPKRYVVVSPDHKFLPEEMELFHVNVILKRKLYQNFDLVKEWLENHNVECCFKTNHETGETYLRADKVVGEAEELKHTLPLSVQWYFAKTRLAQSRVGNLMKKIQEAPGMLWKGLKQLSGNLWSKLTSGRKSFKNPHTD
jgi:hypothetical protein